MGGAGARAAALVGCTHVERISARALHQPVRIRANDPELQARTARALQVQQAPASERERIPARVSIGVSISVRTQRQSHLPAVRQRNQQR